MTTALTDDITSTNVTTPTTGSGYQSVVTLKQQVEGWQTTADLSVGGFDVSKGTPLKDGTATVLYTPASGSTAASTTITFST